MSLRLTATIWPPDWTKGAVPGPIRGPWGCLAVPIRGPHRAWARACARWAHRARLGPSLVPFLGFLVLRSLGAHWQLVTYWQEPLCNPAVP